MNALSLSTALPSPLTPPLQAQAVGAIAPLAFAAAEAQLPLPQSQALPVAPADSVGHQEAAAMRPDQVFMARQLVFAQVDGRTLAGTWRSMVGNYGATLLDREVRARGGALTPALMLAGQDGRAPEGQVLPADAWRFTVHAGSAQAQRLHVLGKEADGAGGRRRRPRAALRLELTLADGTQVALQAEAVPGGVALELAAPDAAALARLRVLQPALDAAVARAGLTVLRWRFRVGILPAGSAHAALAAEDAAQVLTMPVFRAVAELALVLPAQG